MMIYYIMQKLPPTNDKFHFNRMNLYRLSGMSKLNQLFIFFEFHNGKSQHGERPEQ